MTELRAVEPGTAVKAPARATYEYLASYGSLLLFALVCLGWSLLALPISALLPPALRRRLGRLGIFWGLRLYAHRLRRVGAYRLDLAAHDQLQGAGPLILAPNHPSLIDAVLIAVRVPNLACLTKAEPMGNMLLGPGALPIETDSEFFGKGCPLWARPSLPIGYRVRLGRRFDPPRDPAAFRQKLERYYRSELQSGSSSCR